MDLADIRKKAKASRKTQSLPKFEEVILRSSPSIQGKPAEREHPSPLEATRPVEARLPQQSPAEDPLDALFSFRPDFDLTTEEGYLQTLRAKEEEAKEELCEWLTFSLGKEEYALDIDGVNEIIKQREITDIPRVPGFILGVISLRGIIIPVYDLKQRLKLGVGEFTPTSRIIVCQKEGRTAGLLVDAITQVVRTPASAIEPPPPVLSGFDRELIEGVGRHQGRMLILLNLSSILNAELT